MTLSAVIKKLWCVRKQLILILTPLVLLPLHFTLPEKVSRNLLFVFSHASTSAVFVYFSIAKILPEEVY